jgi:maleate isomerase
VSENRSAANQFAKATRIGLIVPSSNTTMETELPELFRRQTQSTGQPYTFHSSRARMTTVNHAELAAMVGAAERCAVEVSDAAVEVIAYACLVAVMAQGEGAHLEQEELLRKAAADNGHPAPVVSSAGALVRTIKVMGAKKVAIVTPYMKPLTDLVARYIESEGIGVVDAVSLEVDDNREVGRLDTANLPGVARAMRREGADAVVLSACVQMPSLAAVPAVEEECGLPVLTAATATAFEVLSALGHSPQIDRAGRLLTGAVVAADV